MVDEIQRNRYLIEPGLRAGVTWDNVVAGVRDEVTQVIDRDGAFIMSERHGLFACS